MDVNEHDRLSNIKLRDINASNGTCMYIFVSKVFYYQI